MSILKSLYINSKGESISKEDRDINEKLIHIYYDDEYRVFTEYYNEKSEESQGVIAPGNFGILLYKLNPKAMSLIEDFLKEIYEQPHMIEAYEKCKPFFNLENNADSYAESYGNDDYEPPIKDVETFGKLYLACYPVFVSLFPKNMNYCCDGFYGVVAGYAMYGEHLSENTFKGFVSKLFGAWRKDAGKAVVNSNPEMIELVYTLRKYDLFTAEQLIYILNNYELLNSDMIIDYRCSYMKNLSRATSFRLICQLISESLNYYHIQDTLDMLDICGKRKEYRHAKNWDDLHEITMNLCPAIKYKSRIELPEEFVDVCEEFNQLNSGLILKPMLSSYDFNQTGDDLNICIGKGRYFKTSLKGEGYCFNLWRDNEIYGALEILKVKNGFWKVREVSGVNNTTLPETDFIRSSLFDSLKVINEGIKEPKEKESNLPQDIQELIEYARNNGNVIQVVDEGPANVAPHEYNEDLEEDFIFMAL